MNQNEILVYCRLKADGYTKQAIAAVMGVCGGESGFQTLSEIGYTTTPNANIRNIFYKLANQSDAYINQCKTSDYNFFNCVYGGDSGNGPTEGYKYRGRGFNGLTFKSNYERIGNKINSFYKINIDLVQNPELLEQPKYAAMALSMYFYDTVKNINDFETAFQEAYRQNAGPGYSFAVYAASQNYVHLYGIPKKRDKAKYYLDAINNGEFSNACGGSSGMLGASGILTSFPIVFFLTLGGYFLYKKYRK